MKEIRMNRRIFNSKTFYFMFGFITGLSLFLIVGSYILFSGSTINTEFPQGYKIISPEIPDEIDFCGEPVPLQNFEVYERIDREFLVNTYWHSATLLSFKRANRWFPVIEEILKANNVPEDFKYMALIESGLSNAVSPVGATGFWQFMEGTAIKYDLEVDKEIDERYHLEKATEAACKYLKEAYEELGSWTLSAASYNMGIDRVKEQLGRQKTSNYYNLVLNEETSRFVARIIAMKEIFKHPGKFGFDLSEEKFYSPLGYKEVQINGPVNDLADFAAGQGINYKILKMYNPWLRENYLTNKSGKTYTIKIPEEGSIEIIKE
jgi:membrane-bound lytic murein transglycosylase D